MGTGVAMNARNWRTAPWAALAAVALVAGCGGGPGNENGNGTVYGEVGSAVRSLITGRDGGGRVTATAEQLRNNPDPLIVVAIPKRDLSAGLTRQAVIPGGEVWATQGGVTVTLENGQIRTTRGIGHDLMSVEAPDVRTARGGTVRDHYQLGGDELPLRLRYFCEIADAGPQRVTVAGVSYPTRLITERCRSDAAAFENRYWVQSNGLIRKSVQFVTPELGPFEIEDIHG
ncbi:hypothetical protein DXV76_06310 [Rhodobacteraceae bacterium CCMM004]|nr:hypothetical protein DXV76_06310 [Rhodobacteraceae bacterium CCMM004]